MVYGTYNRRRQIWMTTTFIAIGIALLGACGLLITQAVWLHQAEVAEQIAQIGYYKMDVYLNFGRTVAKYACIFGALFSGIASLVALFLGFAR